MSSPPRVQNQFAPVLLRAVLVCYAVWGGVVVFDLVQCVNNWPYSTGLGAPKGFIRTGIRTGIRAGRPKVTWNY